jgi:hypothetical protein
MFGVERALSFPCTETLYTELLPCCFAKFSCQQHFLAGFKAG